VDKDHSAEPPPGGFGVSRRQEPDPPGEPPPLFGPERPPRVPSGGPEPGPTRPPARPDVPPAPPPPPVPTMPGDRTFLLREMGIGELLDASIKVYRQNWKPLMLVVAIVIVPFALVEGFATRVPEDVAFDQATFDRVTIFALVFGVVRFAFVQPFLTGAMARATYSLYLGEGIDVRRVYRTALLLLLPILWVSFLAALGVAVGLILLIVPGVIAAVRFAFGSTVIVVEGLRGTEALARTWRLAKGKFWRILGTLFLANLLAGVAAAILTLPTSAAIIPLGPEAWPLQAFGASVAAVITTPFTTLVTVLLYFDLRIRKEGFDLAVMAQELAGRGEGA
jgi:hypothetical protein